MTTELSEDERNLYMEVLRDSPTPFDRFVSKGKIEDVIDVQGARKIMDRAIFRALAQTQLDQSTRLIPIIGEAGSGKTHTYWAFKDKEKKLTSADQAAELDEQQTGPKDWTIVYVPSPPASIRIFLHVYTCMIDELGSNILNSIADKLVEKWGGGKKKHFGLFGSSNIEEIIQAGIREYPGVSADCAKALVLYAMSKDDKIRGLAERWLLGEQLDEGELELLQISSVIEEDDIALAMIKIISEQTDKTIVLYFDECESPLRMHGKEAARRFYETIKVLYNTVNNLLIIIAVLDEVWNDVLDVMDKALISRMEPEHRLQKWTLDDLKLFYAKSMLHFWNSNNLNPPSDPLFPLNDVVLQTIYSKTDGNQRSIIKLIRIFVEKIVLGDMTLEELIKDEQLKAHAQKAPLQKSEIDEQIKKLAEEASKSSEGKSDLAVKVEQMMQEESFIIEVNPASVAASCFKSIKLLCDKFGKTCNIDIEFKFMQGKRAVTLAGLITYNGKKYALDIPAIKGFDRPGGVSAFYAVKRLESALQLKAIDAAILVTSPGTKGQKYTSILKQHPELMIYEINQEQADALLRGAASSNPTMEAYTIAKMIIPDLPEYTPQPEAEKTA